MVKVSVIVPVYNSSKHLRKCLDSLKKQTLDDIEFIIVNDCSTDDSLDIISEYLDDPRFILINNERNSGAGYSRNMGISRSRGKYIGFVDSDDYISISMYENMYKCAIYNDCDIVVSNLSFVKDDNGNYNSSCSNNTTGYKIDYEKDPEMIYFESPSVCNKLYRSELAKKHPFVEGTMFEDIAFTYNMLMMANSVYRLNNHDYFYRKGYDGVSSIVYKPSYHINDIFAVCDDIGSCALKNGHFDKFYEQVKFLQISSSLIRISEIIEWEIDDFSKDKIIVNFLNLINKRYGDYHDLDRNLLSMKFSILDMDYIEKLHSSEISKKNTLKI